MRSVALLPWWTYQRSCSRPYLFIEPISDKPVPYKVELAVQFSSGRFRLLGWKCNVLLFSPWCARNIYCKCPVQETAFTKLISEGSE